MRHFVSLHSSERFQSVRLRLLSCLPVSLSSFLKSRVFTPFSSRLPSPHSTLLLSLLSVCPFASEKEGNGFMCTPAIVLTLYSNSLSLQILSVDNGEKLSQRLYKRLNKEEVSPCAVRSFRARSKTTLAIPHFRVSHAAIHQRTKKMKSMQSDGLLRINAISAVPPKRSLNVSIVGVS
jgi:hypothetical protein